MTSERKQILFGKDSVIIQKYIAGIPGGRALDVTDVTDEVLHAGHIIITNGKGEYKPLKTTTASGITSYDTLPTGYSYAGILYRSILAKKPSAAIMISGVVNDAAVEIPYGTHKDAIKSALPTIMFVKDEVSDSTATATTPEEEKSENETESENH